MRYDMTLHRLLPVLLAASCGSSPAEPSDHESELHTKIPELFAVTTVGGTGLGLQMAQDSTHVFWFHETGGYIVAAGPILSRSKLGLDPPQVLVADTWISNIFSRKFASDGGSFFWFDSTIYRVAKTGGAPIALTSSTAAGAVAAIAVDTQHLWFTNGAGLH